MLLPRRQPSDRGDDFLARQFQSVFNRHPFQHLCERGTTDKRRRTAISEESHGLYAAVTNSQTEPQTIAAHWIRLFSYGIGAG